MVLQHRHNILTSLLQSSARDGKGGATSILFVARLGAAKVDSVEIRAKGRESTRLYFDENVLRSSGRRGEMATPEDVVSVEAVLGCEQDESLSVQRGIL